jgi:phage terminase large subunit-like protein
MERLTPSGGNPIWNLADLKTGGFFRPISSEQSFSGPMPSCALCDEVHEHRNADAIEMLERGFKSRRQPLLLMITNSGFDPKTVSGQEHLHAIRVAAGHMEADKDPAFVGDVIDDRAFSYVCGLDADDDPLEDSTCWIKANPLIGISQPWDELQTAVGQAKQIPGRLNGILRLHFCVWTDAEEAWMSRAALESVLADFEPEEHFGSKVYGGVDLSATRDFTALAFVVHTGMTERIRKEKDGREIPVMLPTYDAWVEAWSPAETLGERALHDQQPYDVWARDGHLTATPGKVVRMDFVAARVAEAQHQYEIVEIAYDAYGFKRMFEPELDALGVTVTLVEHPQGGKRRAAPSEEQKDEAKLVGAEKPQGLWMPGSVVALENLILDERIRIRRNPVQIQRRR